MARPASLKPTSTGVYYRQIGYLQSGSQPRFNLGTDRIAALERNAKLEQLWQIITTEAPGTRHSEGEIGPGKPAWDTITHAIALAIAKGADRFVVPQPPEMADADSYFYFVHRYAEPFGKLIPILPTSVEAFEEAARKEAEKHREFVAGLARKAEIAFPTVGGIDNLPTGQTVHQALDAYCEHIQEVYRDEESRITEWGEVQVDQVAFIRRQTTNCDLSQFGLGAIESTIEVIRKRPPAATKHKRPISRTYTKNSIKQFRKFLRWLHRAESFRWRKPEDYEVRAVRIPKSESERGSALSATQVATYSREELGILWKAADPMDRLLMALALNCGFGKREVATLRLSELHFRQTHPYADVLQMPSRADDSWVMRLRGKTEVYGEWRLWPVTVVALEWYLKRRPTSESSFVLVDRYGNPLEKRTAGNNTSSAIANYWSALTTRIRKDTPTFRSLSFNKLRKTGQNYLRSRHSAEVASVYASRGKPFPADDLLEVYTNKPFARVHAALRDFETWLQPVLEATPNPFPDNWHKTRASGGPNISQATIANIQALHRAGRRIADIAREVGLSRETVRRWVNRGDKTHDPNISPSQLDSGEPKPAK